jgi:hypothetical protein
VNFCLSAIFPGVDDGEGLIQLHDCNF